MHQLKYSVPYSAFTPSSEMLNARTISLRIGPLLGLGSPEQTTRSPGINRPAVKPARHDGSELRGPGGVHQVPGRDRDQLAARDQRGHIRELPLIDVAGRAARDEQGRGLDVPERVAPGADRR